MAGVRFGDRAAVPGLILLALTSVPAGAQQVTELRPVPGSAWQVNVEDNGCTLSRSFGTEEQQVELILHSAGGLGQFEIALGGRGVTDLARSGTAMLRVDGRDAPSVVGLVTLPPSQVFRYGAVRMAGDHPGWKTLRSAGVPVEIVTPQQSYRFVGASFLGAMRAADSCLDTIWRNDGLDPAVVRSAATLATPEGDPARWATVDDYPVMALREEAQGRTVSRLRVEADGRVTACHVAISSRNTVLDARSCRLLQDRARFQPARDANGAPVATVVVRSINWMLPGRL